MNYRTIRVRWDGTVCYVQFWRPQHGNTINAEVINECTQILNKCEEEANIVVFEGTRRVFCLGADFGSIRENYRSSVSTEVDAAPLYELWEKIAKGTYLSIAYVEGKVNAGGVGFVAACDIAIAGHDAQFSLSELLFGLMPACVMPFLVRRIGFQRANYLALITWPVSAVQAYEWGLVDAHDERPAPVLHRHMLRLRHLSKVAIRRYKSYMSQINGSLETLREQALAANHSVFADERNLEGIARYLENGSFPWEDQ